MHKYDVTCNGKVVGCVHLTKEGLYTRFQCTCQLPDEGIYRLYMIFGEQKTDLGVCVPTKTQYTVNRCLQSKLIPNGELSFYILSVSQNTKDSFIPISGDMPFEKISSIEHAKLCNQNGRYGILIVDQPKSK